MKEYVPLEVYKMAIFLNYIVKSEKNVLFEHFKEHVLLHLLDLGPPMLQSIIGVPF